MVLGVRVLTFDAARQREEHRFGTLEFIGVGLQFQQGPNPGKQLTAIYRLGQKIISPAGDPPYTIFCIGKSSDQDDRGETSFFIGLNSFADLKPVWMRHHYVEHYEVRPGRFKHPESRCSI